MEQSPEAAQLITAIRLLCRLLYHIKVSRLGRVRKMCQELIKLAPVIQQHRAFPNAVPLRILIILETKPVLRILRR